MKMVIISTIREESRTMMVLRKRRRRERKRRERERESMIQMKTTSLSPLPDECHLYLSTLCLKALYFGQEGEEEGEDEIESADDHRKHQSL